MKHAIVHTETPVLLRTGRFGTLLAGRYEVAEVEGTDGELFLIGPNSNLVQAVPNDPNITIEES